jgi:hypothetical protein
MGGYDIFVSKYASASKDFLSPENVGFPFNSTANDYLMVLDENQKTGWFATDRNQPMGKVIVYSYQLNDPKRYFRSADSIKIYEVASLKSYRRATSIKPGKTDKLKPDNSISTTNQIVINDSTIYTNIKQFKSNISLEFYEKYLQTRNTLENKTQQLEVLRTNYADASPEEKSDLFPKIIQFETDIITDQTTLANIYKSAINEENKFLSSN